jgi:hypothetical protein
MYQNLGNNQDIIESTVAPYMSMATGTTVAGMPLKILLGARYEATHVTSDGISTLPDRGAVRLDHRPYGLRIQLHDGENRSAPRATIATCCRISI